MDINSTIEKHKKWRANKDLIKETVERFPATPASAEEPKQAGRGGS